MAHSRGQIEVGQCISPARRAFLQNEAANLGARWMEPLRARLIAVSPEKSGHASATTTADGIYVVAVLKAQSDWVKVAQLERQ